MSTSMPYAGHRFRVRFLGGASLGVFGRMSPYGAAARLNLSSVHDIACRLDYRLTGRAGMGAG